MSEFGRMRHETMPWAGFRSTLVSGGGLLLSSGRLASCHVMFLFDVFPHAFGLSFYVEAVFEVAYEHQSQMVADVIVHGHVVADQVDAQRAITFTERLLLVPRVTHGDFADCIVGKKAGKSHHNLGVVSVYIIGHDDSFIMGAGNTSTTNKVEAPLFPMVAPNSVFKASYRFHSVELGSLL